MVVVLILLFFFIEPIENIPQGKYFYKGRTFGSEANYNPINLILNGSFDILQLQNHNRDIFNFPYKKGIQNVFENLGDPFTSIKQSGWESFIEDEIFPVHLTRKGAQWWPNYQLHLIGGGMTFTAMKEWYEYYNFPAPVVASITTMAVYHLLNEVVENGTFSGYNVDPIADIYFFDIGGIVLFSFDSINKFFSEELNLSDWSLQPSFLLNDYTLQNNGQNFSIKWKLPFSEHFHLFYYCGMNGLIGASYKFQDGSAISFGGGLRAKDLEVLDASTNKKTITLTWNFGLFYDQDNSLLSSVFISGLTDYKVDINIYPGVLKINSFSPGLWCVVKDNGNVLIGLSTMWTPGLAYEL